MAAVARTWVVELITITSVFGLYPWSKYLRAFDLMSLTALTRSTGLELLLEGSTGDGVQRL